MHPVVPASIMSASGPRAVLLATTALALHALPVPLVRLASEDVSFSRVYNTSFELVVSADAMPAYSHLRVAAMHAFTISLRRQILTQYHLKGYRGVPFVRSWAFWFNHWPDISALYRKVCGW